MYEVRWTREGRWYVAVAPGVPGAVAQAYSRAQLARYMREVFELLEIAEPYLTQWRRVPLQQF